MRTSCLSTSVPGPSMFVPTGPSTACRKILGRPAHPLSPADSSRVPDRFLITFYPVQRESNGVAMEPNRKLRRYEIFLGTPIGLRWARGGVSVLAYRGNYADKENQRAARGLFIRLLRQMS